MDTRLKYEFRLIAMDETYHWAGLPEGCEAVYGVYLFRVGEATFCASMSASSWCEFVENQFIGLDGDHPFVQEHWPDGSSNYFRFIDTTDPRLILSEPIVIEVEGPESDRTAEEAWEDALETVRSNPPYVPVPV